MQQRPIRRVILQEKRNPILHGGNEEQKRGRKSYASEVPLPPPSTLESVLSPRVSERKYLFSVEIL